MKKRAVRSVISTLPVLVMLTTMILLSLGNVYGSPRVYDPNLQVTKMEIAGTKWFEIEKTGIPVSGNNPSQIGRFEDYNFGVDSSSLSPALIGSRVPSHFGYDYSNHTAQSLGFKHAYVLVFQLDIVAPLLFPENVRPKVHQYTENDFARLASDPIVTVLYENGEFRVFFVR